MSNLIHTITEENQIKVMSYIFIDKILTLQRLLSGEDGDYNMRILNHLKHNFERMLI